MLHIFISIIMFCHLALPAIMYKPLEFYYYYFLLFRTRAINI